MKSPLLLFYPTSPVHVSDFSLLVAKLPEWRFVAVLNRPLAQVAPGIDLALRKHAIEYVALDAVSNAEDRLPRDTAVLLLGAAFEIFALDLMAWAKQRAVPVVAIEEVSQLALNRMDINNYDAPFDRLFVASNDEQRLLLERGYPSEMLRVSGLLATDRFETSASQSNETVLERLGITDGHKPIVYTTSPLRHRLAIHNKDDLPFRQRILAGLAAASRRTGRRLVVKLHPNEIVESNRKLVAQVFPDAIVVGREFTMDELFPVAAVIVNRGNSQTSLESVLRGVPTVIAACGLETLFHHDGGAVVIDNMADLANAVENALDQGGADNSGVRAKHFARPPEGVAGFIAREITALARKPWPADERSWQWLVKSMLFVGRHDHALSVCEQLAFQAKWLARVKAALRAHAAGQVHDAVRAWSDLSALDPRWFFPHYELAHAFLATQDFDRAIAHARRAIALHPPFHRLWHEIPMRVVIMASLRSKGDLAAASAELKPLEEQGFLEVVPELLIEAAAHRCLLPGQLEEAERCLDKAFEQLKLHPVDQVGDRHILERAARQYVDLAEKYAQTGDSARATGCLERMVESARSDVAVLRGLFSHLAKLGEKREMAADYLVADKCYALAIQADPTAHWLRYRQSSMALKQRNLTKALQGLLTIARIPNAPRATLEKIFTANDMARLTPYWPASAKSIVKPFMLCLCMLGWFFGKLARAGLCDIHTSICAVVLVCLFVARHFVRRLRAELSKIRGLFYKIRSILPRPFSSRGDRVINCPICGARGKFEYQNKLTPLFRCSNCEHVYARDLPDDQTLNALYGDLGYWERDRYHQGITAIQESEQWRTYLNARIGILQKLKLLDNPDRPTKKIFEIGCAEGMLLRELSKRGLEVLGCEMNRVVAAEGIKTLGVNILTAPFETIELPAKNFDLVISFHTLEHLRDPARIVAKVAHILRPDGALLLEVPCGEEEYENTDHLHFFSETSLRALLNKFFVTTEILDNSYTNSVGVRIGSLYGFGQALKGK